MTNDYTSNILKVTITGVIVMVITAIPVIYQENTYNTNAFITSFLNKTIWNRVIERSNNNNKKKMIKNK